MLYKKKDCCCRDAAGGKKYTGKERIPGRTVIVTGATSGIGKETAKELANRGKLLFAPHLLCHMMHLSM